MTQEEKAKTYDELFIKAKQIYNKENDVLIMHTIEDLFPELKESEDERIRKVLIELVKCNEKSGYKLLNNVPTSSMIAWLEKQGEQKYIPKYKIGDYIKNTNYKGEPIYEIVYMDKECYICEYRGKERMGDKAVMHFSFDNPYLRLVQKPTDKVEPKFKVGDWIVGANSIYKITSLNDELSCYIAVTTRNEEVKIPYYFDCAQGHMCSYRLWTIQDAKDGDVLQLGSVTAIFQKYIGNGNCKCYCSVYNGELEIPSQDGTDNSYGCCNAVPATKEQRDLLFQKMKEAGYMCSKRYYRWSEEDELYMNECINAIATKGGWTFEEKRKTKHWLESLKQRIRG